MEFKVKKATNFNASILMLQKLGIHCLSFFSSLPSHLPKLRLISSELKKPVCQRDLVLITVAQIILDVEAI